MNIFPLLLIAFSYFLDAKTSDVDYVLKRDYDNKYFSAVKCIMLKELHENRVQVDTIYNRNYNRNNINLLLIPQFILRIDTIEMKAELIFDSINPINRAILFKKNEHIASLLFNTISDTIFCPKKITVKTHFDCVKYIYVEKEYEKSLKYLFKKKPILIFKCGNFERCWFYVNVNREICVYTYDKEDYYFEDFIKLKDFSKYSVSLSLAKWVN